MTQEDRDLRQQFATLREQERSSAPAFARVWADARGRLGVERGAWGGPMVLAAAGLLLLSTLALLRPSARLPRAEAPPPAPAGWRSPTDFLLETPGLELLRRVPSVGRIAPAAPSPEGSST